MSTRPLLRVLLLLAIATPLQAQDATLDALLGAPFPEDLVAAPTGGTVAWVHITRGVRNVWAAAGPDYRGRQLTAYTVDDGQEIADLAFSADGRTLYYVRGGAPNRSGEIPNPDSDPAGQERAVWRVSVSGGAPVRVGVGSGPAPAPKGDALLFLNRGQIWSAGERGEARQLVKARGSIGELVWSPDGSKVAFSSRRGDHAFVGVYDVGAKRLAWIDPSFDTDVDPAWSPDGRRIAFIRIPAGFNPPLFGPIRQYQPWSIRVADVATGAGHEVWRALDGKGSVLHGVVGPTLIWAAGDRLVFPWERDGWSHLYALDAAGGQPTLLTPGEGEVEYVAAAPDRRSIIYNTNIGDIDRRHLFQVSVAGGAPTALTTGTGIEWAPAPTADGQALAFLASDATTPGHPAVEIGGQVRSMVEGALPAGFPSAQLVTPEQVIFSASDGLQIHGQLFLPKNARAGDHRPALLFFHGGSRRQMLLGWHYMFYYSNAYAMNQYLAGLGYVVLSVNYRSGVGYGMEFREALDYGATGATEFNDVMGAGLYLQHRPEVDPDRIGLWGGSYGGYLTAMGLAKASNLFKAGVDLHGVHDWNEGIQTFVPSYNPLDRPEAARLAFESSPLAWVDTWKSPVLVIQGDDDRNVDFHQTVRLITALRARGVTVEQLAFPDEVHDFLAGVTWRRAYAATADFFQRRLGRP